MASFYTEAGGDTAVHTQTHVKGDMRAVASVASGAVVEFVFVEGGFRLPVPAGFAEVMAERRLM